MDSNAIDTLIEESITLHQSGQLDAAQTQYERILALAPNHPIALGNLGFLKLQKGHLEEGVNHIATSLSILPAQPHLLNNQIIALRELKRFNEAIQYCDLAIETSPDVDDLHVQKGNILQQMHMFADALKCYDQALALNPHSAQIYYNKALASNALGNSQDALTHYNAAIAIQPNFAQAYANKAAVLHALGRLQDALQSYNQAITLKPDYAEAYYNRGNVLKELNTLDEVVANYDKAIALSPQLIAAHFNRANILQQLKKMPEALVGYDHVIALNPQHVDAHFNRANVLKKINMFEDAVESYHRVIALNPNHADAYYNLGNTLRSLKKLEVSLEHYDRAIAINPQTDFVLGVSLFTKANLCMWDNFPALTAQLLRSIGKQEKVILPFASLALIDDPDIQKQVAEIYCQTYIQKDPQTGQLPAKLKPYPQPSKGAKIRIGYFSADFRNHPVSFLTAELYELHSRDRFEIHAFSLALDNGDEMNNRIKAAVDHYHIIHHLTDEEAVKLARSLKIDIAVDLGGYTQDSRTKIFALQAAPVQVSYIGYLGTMGLSYYDYLIADKTLVPQEQQQYYCEKIAYLPCWQVNDSNKLLPSHSVTRKEFGLPETGFVFCCFNNTYKITPDVFDSWARILQAVQGSVLFIYASTQTAAKNLTKEIKRRGINPDRLIFGTALDKQAYLARFKAADLFLDTFPYNAGTTASDALQMGLPLVTFTGKTFAGKAAASILNAANLPELIATSKQHYEALAIHLAKNPDTLKRIKEKMAQTLLTSPLYDSKSFTKNIERAYQAMHQNSQKNHPPSHIHI